MAHGALTTVPDIHAATEYVNALDRQIAQIADSIAPELRDVPFWDALRNQTKNEALRFLRLEAETPQSRLVADVDTGTLPLRFVEEIVLRHLLWQPWQLVALTGSPITIVVRQLLIATEARTVQLVFTVCCEQCGVELGVWPTVSAVYRQVAEQLGGAMSCHLCGNLSVFGPPDTRLTYSRVKCLFVPRSNDLRGAASLVSSKVSVPPQPLPLLSRHSLRPVVSTRTFLTDKAKRNVLLRMAAAPHSVAQSRVVSLPRGVYTIVLPNAAVALDLVVITDPDAQSGEPCIVRVPLLHLVSKAQESDRQIGGSVADRAPCVVDRIEVRHGRVRIELDNGLDVAMPLYVMVFTDLRLELVIPPRDSQDISEGRMLPVTALLHGLPGGLTNAELVAAARPPDGVVTPLPPSYVVCAVVVPWENSATLLRHGPHVERGLAEICVVGHSGLLLETAHNSRWYLLLFRSHTAAVAAAACFGRFLAVSPLPSLAAATSVVIVGSGTAAPILLESILTTPASSRAYALPCLTAPLRAHGPAVEALGSIASPLLFSRDPPSCAANSTANRQDFSAQSEQPCRRTPCFSVTLADCIAVSDTNGGTTSAWVPFRTAAPVEDPLVLPLIDKLQYAYRGVTVSAPSVEASVSRNATHLSDLFQIHFDVEGGLATTDALTLPDVLDPALVDPLDESSDDFV